MFQATAFQVILELTLQLGWPFPALFSLIYGERRVILFDDLIEQDLLGPVALLPATKRTSATLHTSEMGVMIRILAILYKHTV